MPEIVLEFTANPDMTTFNNDVLDHMKDITNKYEYYKTQIRNGVGKKTPRFWMMYLDLIKQQHFAHTAVQENNFEMLVHFPGNHFYHIISH